MASEAITGFRDLIDKIAGQGNRQAVFERFKERFAGAAGRPYYPSSSASWASDDLNALLDEAAANAPLFVDAFCTACDDLHTRQPDLDLPGIDHINRILLQTESGYRIDWPRLVATQDQRPVVVPAQPPSLDQQARKLIADALQSSEQALAEGNGRQAIQDVLWLLESVSTAFRSDDGSDDSVQGRYFNKIIGELRKRGRGHQVRILDWMMALHGYLSSPTGGGVRHGVDLREGLNLSIEEARLYCNLARSYLTYLLDEHQRLTRRDASGRPDAV